MSKIRVDVSQPEHTAAGLLLCKMYYGTVLDDLLAKHEFSGFPHNGGEHTLRLHLSAEDFDAFLGTIAERYPHHPGLVSFIQSSISNAIKNHPQNITLAAMKNRWMHTFETAPVSGATAIKQ